MNLINEFLQNYTTLFPDDDIGIIPPATSLPELLVCMEGNKIQSDFDFYSFYMWIDTQMDYENPITHTPFLRDLVDNLNYREGPVTDAANYVEEEAKAVLQREIDQTLVFLWPKNTYSFESFMKDLRVIHELNTHNPSFPISIQETSQLPNMVIIAEGDITPSIMKNLFSDIYDQYNMVTYRYLDSIKNSTSPQGFHVHLSDMDIMRSPKLFLRVNIQDGKDIQRMIIEAKDLPNVSGSKLISFYALAFVIIACAASIGLPIEPTNLIAC